MLQLINNYNRITWFSDDSCLDIGYLTISPFLDSSVVSSIIYNDII